MMSNLARQAVKMSIIVVDGSFRESFHSLDYFAKQTLPANEYELIWVEYYDQVRPELAAKMARHSNFRTITLKRQGLYHAAYCFNEGIRQSRGDIIVMADGDIVAEEDLLETIWDEHQKTDELVMFTYRYDEPKEAHREHWDLPHLRNVCRLYTTSNYGPCMSVRKKWLVSVNGYEQHPVFATGFHAAPREMYIRLKNLGLPIKWHPAARVYHPWHPSTGTGSLTYDLQLVIMGFKDLHGETKSYDGLDARRNVPQPPELIESLKNAEQLIRRLRGGPLAVASYYLAIASQRFKHLRAFRERAALPEGYHISNG